MSQGRRRFLIVGISAGVFVVAGLVVLRYTVFHDDATALPVDQIQHRYRDDIERSSRSTTRMTTDSPTTGSSTPSAAPFQSDAPSPATAAVATTLMPPGIYRYETTGHESVDALGGTSHGYPRETTISVTPDGCGVLLRWDLLAQRRDEWRLCAATDGIDLEPTGLQYHEFFGQADSEDVVCDREIVLVPATDRPSEPATLDCTLASDPWVPTWAVLGREQRTVEGSPVQVVHVRMTVEDDDEYFEHTTIDWYLDLHGLPIEASGTKTSRSPSPIGPVLYEEQFSLQIQSLDPLQ